MERQSLYRQKAEARGGEMRQGQVVAPSGTREWVEGIFAAAAAAGEALLDASARTRRAELAEALLNADAEFERWKILYMSKNMGRAALSAQRDFVEKHAEIALAALEKFGGHGETFRDELAEGLRLRAFHALRDGGAWQRRQLEEWENSVFASEKAAFVRTIAENPDNPDWLQIRGRELLRSWMAKNPGLDEGAARAEIGAMIDRGRKQAMDGGL